MVKPLLTAREAGVATPNLLLGIGAALHYFNPEDAQSVTMHEKIEALGVKAAMAEFAALDKNAPILDEIATAYNEVEKAIE